MTATHLLIDTGRASHLAACDEPFANGQPGADDLALVTCKACLDMFGRLHARPMTEPEMSEQIEAVMDAHRLEVTRHERLRGRDVDVCRCGSTHPTFDDGRWPTHQTHVAQQIAKTLGAHGVS